MIKGLFKIYFFFIFLIGIVTTSEAKYCIGKEEIGGFSRDVTVAARDNWQRVDYLKNADGVYKAKILLDGGFEPWGESLEECRVGRSSEGMVITSEPPCELKGGVGLYALISLADTGENEANPNDYENQLLPDDKFKTIHVGEYARRKSDGRYEANIEFRDIHVRNSRLPLYFRIMSNSTNTNLEDRLPHATGEYQMFVVEGATTDVGNGMIKGIITTFRELVNRAMLYMYSFIAGNLGLRDLIMSMVLLYVIFTTVAFLVGFIEITQQEFISRLLKIGFVILMISEDSVEFFNDYLYGFFVEGMRELSHIITENMVSEIINSGSNIPSTFRLAEQEDVYDKIWEIVFSGKIILKLVALFFDFAIKSGLVGILTLFLVPYGLYKFTIAVLGTALIYLISILQISVLLVMAPLFVSFILFDITRKYFDSWIKALISSSLTWLIVTAAICFLMPLFLMYLHKILFYKICLAELRFKVGEFFDVLVPLYYPYISGSYDVTINDVIGFLLIVYLSVQMVNILPSIIDQLSDAPETPTSRMVGAAKASTSAKIQSAKSAGIKAVGAAKVPAKAAGKAVGRTLGKGMDKLKKTGVYKKLENKTLTMKRNVKSKYESSKLGKSMGYVTSKVQQAKDGYKKLSINVDKSVADRLNKYSEKIRGDSEDKKD